MLAEQDVLVLAVGNGRLDVRAARDVGAGQYRVRANAEVLPARAAAVGHRLVVLVPADALRGAAGQ